MAGIDNNTIIMLNGKLEDCSLSPKTIINDGVTINSEGKFGDCYNIDTDKTLNFDVNLSNEFTIEWLEFRTATANHQYIFSNSLTKNTKNIFMVGYNGSNANNGSSISFYYGVNESSFLANGSVGQIMLNQWVHRAITYRNNSLKFYQNGSIVNTFTVSNLNLNTLYLGGCWDTSSSNAIKIDEFRVSDICRYESDFTVPTEAFTIDSPTINISYQGRDKIEFSLSNTELFLIESVEVFVNDNLTKTFTSNYIDLDVELKNLVKGNNSIVIKINFDNKYVEKEINIYSYVYNDLSLKEVMDEFEKISLMDLTNSDMNIICRDILPDSANEGQICIISENPTDNIFIGQFESDLPENFDGIFVYLSPVSTNFPLVIEGKTNIKLHFLSVTQNNRRLNSYIYKNGTWESVTLGTYILLRDGIRYCEDVFGYFKKFSGSQTFEWNKSKKGYWVDSSSINYGSVTARHTKKIDLSRFSKVTVKIKDYLHDGHESKLLCMDASGSTIASRSIANGTISLDLSNINVEGYIGFLADSWTKGIERYLITDIEVS